MRSIFSIFLVVFGLHARGEEIPCAPALAEIALTPARKTANEVASLLLEKNAVPSVATDRALYRRWMQYRTDPEFQETLKRKLHYNRTANRTYREALMPPPQKAAYDLIEYFNQHQKLPTRTEGGPLYQRIMTHRNHPEFQNELAENELADPARRALLASSRPAFKDAALDVSTFYRENGRLPTYEDGAIYRRYREGRSNPEFISSLSSAELRRLVAEDRGTLASTTRKTADDLAAFLLEHEKLPAQRASLAESALYQRYSRIRRDPDFLAYLQANPAAWRLYEYANLTSAGKTGRDLADFIRQNGVLPTVETSPDLANRMANYRQAIDLIGELKKDEVAWTIYEAGLRQKTPLLRLNSSPAMTREQQFLKAVEDMANRHSLGFKEGEKAEEIFEDFLERTTIDQKLLAELQSKPFQWKGIRGHFYKKPEVVALETAQYLQKHGTFPLAEVDPVLHEAFGKMKSKNEFRETLKNADREAYDRLQLFTPRSR